jgi:hypothetical protein
LRAPTAACWQWKHALRLHLRELVRRVDEEIEARPYLVDALEVPVVIEEGPGRVRDDHEVEVAPLVGVTARDRAEDDGPARSLEVRGQALLESLEVLDHLTAPCARSASMVAPS